MHRFQLQCLCRGTLTQLAHGQPGAGSHPAAQEKSSPTVMPPWVFFFHQVLQSSAGLLPCPSLCLSLCVGDSRVKAVGAQVLFRGAGQASGRRKAELANLFLGALVSHAKDCLNSANPRCLWSNLVYNASASNGCSDRNFLQTICLPKLSGSGRLVFRPQCAILSQRFGDTRKDTGSFLGTTQIHL